MARSKLASPFAFTPWPVTVWCTLVYLALAIGLLVVHLTVPTAPAQVPYTGVNLTQAWLDLQFLTDGYRPYNSRRNDEIRDWLLHRLAAILAGNGADSRDPPDQAVRSWSSLAANATIFNDLASNLSSTSQALDRPSAAVYFESTNIMVYIRGSHDEPGPWWERSRLDGPGGTLINAHYDSVSTGFGATDDGIGVISLLQVIQHFTTEGNQPRHGIVALLNNGEEDFLNGARAFALHPVSRFPTAFLNLEGAGAGGRAAVFRTTDSEVTRAYQGTKYPCGRVVTSDGFKQGLVRSETDYKVFNGNLGMRGVDVAFTEPRSRYHTPQDDARHTSMDSLWHMLSAALHTMHGLSDQTWEKGAGSDGVWFDLLGDSFVDIELHTLFAISVTLLVVAPVTLIITGSALSGSDRLYIFRISQQRSGSAVRLRGLQGLFRTPFVIGVPSVIVIGLALLLVKVNPFIVHSSPFSVWSMMLSVWIFGAWFLAKTADFARPSALHRLYAWLWMTLIFWALLVVVTILEDNAQIASGYFVVWNFLAVSSAAWIGFLELSALEPRKDFADRQLEEPDSAGRRRESNISKNRRVSGTGSGRFSPRVIGEEPSEEAIEEEPTESTSLLRPQRTTFANYASSLPDSTDESKAAVPYEYEQEWSGKLPSWTWLLQLLIAAPITVILVGQVGLDMTLGLYQTLSDGSSPFTVYILLAITAILLLLPLAPFLHRFTYHVPTFLLFVFIATLIYNLIAFPFSSNNRLKVYFKQYVNLDTGINHVGLSSTDNPYITAIVQSLPSSAGQTISQRPSGKDNLVEHAWIGLPPNVVPTSDPLVPPSVEYSSWVSFNVTRTGSNMAHFSIRGRNTKACRILFDKPISDFSVDGGKTDNRFPTFSEHGVDQVRLWSREWDRTWSVNVTWPAQDDETGDGQDGRVVCLWNAAHEGSIPALDEFRRFAPSWAIATKLDDGLVEGFKTFFV